MKATTTDYSYIGVGQIYMRDRHGEGGLVPIGNASVLRFSVSEQAQSMRDYTRDGGGTRNEVRRIEGVECSITIHDLSPGNLALALYGTASEVAAGSVTAEKITVQKGALLPLAKVGATNVSVNHGLAAWQSETAYNIGDQVYAGTHIYEVKTAGTSGSVEPSWKTDGSDTTDGSVTWKDLGKFEPEAGKDYEVRAAGLWIPEDSGLNAKELSVNYEHPAQDVIQALVQAASEYELVFDGLNEARSGKPTVVRVPRLRFGPLGNLDLISDDYAGLELTGTVLADASQGVGMSRFFSTTFVQ